TETLPAREVFHEIQTAIRPLMTHVQTREQVDDLLQSLDAIRYASLRRSRATIHDPPIIQHKGRPRTERITSAIEGRPVGGGARGSKRRREEKENADEPQRKKTKRRCAICHEEGHNRATCLLARD
ncbi:hypothetical protein C8R44DRAFT_643579, partial [Mycena epipterygia]